eukprot:scaffold2161_cov244-Pinguiococcus_pyrenoidosus.AAC.15
MRHQGGRPGMPRRLHALHGVKVPHGAQACVPDGGRAPRGGRGVVLAPVRAVLQMDGKLPRDPQLGGRLRHPVEADELDGPADPRSENELPDFIRRRRACAQALADVALEVLTVAGASPIRLPRRPDVGLGAKVADVPPQQLLGEAQADGVQLEHLLAERRRRLADGVRAGEVHGGGIRLAQRRAEALLEPPRFEEAVSRRHLRRHLVVRARLEMRVVHGDENLPKVLQRQHVLAQAQQTPPAQLQNGLGHVRVVEIHEAVHMRAHLFQRVQRRKSVEASRPVSQRAGDNSNTSTDLFKGVGVEKLLHIRFVRFRGGLLLGGAPPTAVQRVAGVETGAPQR